MHSFISKKRRLQHKSSHAREMVSFAGLARRLYRRVLIVLRRKPPSFTAPTGTHHMLGLETEAFGGASLTRRAPVAAVTLHVSKVTYWL